MLLPNLTFMLLIIIEGYAGPMPTGGACAAKNFSIRIPYEKLEQCEAARRGMLAGGAEQYVMGRCLAIPKDQK